MLRQDTDLRAVAPALLSVLLLAAAARLAVRPLATTDGGAGGHRMTLRGLDQLHVIIHGVGRPLHLSASLVAATSAFDPVERVAWPLPDDPDAVISRYRATASLAADPGAGGRSI